jgi:hypothetical protein
MRDFRMEVISSGLICMKVQFLGVKETVRTRPR